MKNFRASHHRHYKGKERERADGTNNGEEGKRRVGGIEKFDHHVLQGENSKWGRKESCSKTQIK